MTASLFWELWTGAPRRERVPDFFANIHAAALNPATCCEALFDEWRRVREGIHTAYMGWGDQPLFDPASPAALA